VRYVYALNGGSQYEISPDDVVRPTFVAALALRDDELAVGSPGSSGPN
jgi:hypothetical protein